MSAPTSTSPSTYTATDVRLTAYRGPATPADDPIRNASPENLRAFQTVEDYTSTSNIRTEGELNLEWVTPFFLLEWTFTPTHPENLFLSDNSIGLSWKYSY